MKLIAQLFAFACVLALIAMIAANYFHKTEKREEWHRLTPKRKRYFVFSFARGTRFHVIDGDSNIPVYDEAPYGKDKPLIFDDEDRAQQFADDMNASQEEEV